ncbi:MAG: bifunctional glycosyltransferase family 2/GtrA family protein [Christensenellales bacterium]
MNSNNKAVAIIPAYEPDGKLVTLLKQIKEDSGFDAVVINDGSSSGSRELFKEAEEYAVVIHHSENKGKGIAIKTGLSYVQENFPSDTVVITMDADGQHKVTDAVKVCKAAAENDKSLVIGSRIFSGKVPLRSRFGNSVTRFVYKIVTGIKVKDTQTGLRAYNAAFIPFMLNVKGSRYEYEMNVLLECSRQKIDIKQVRIETVYINDNQSSHFNPIKDSYRIYKEIFKFCASSLISFLVDFGIYSFIIYLTRDLVLAQSLFVSTITARVISSALNFYINRRYVFKSNEGLFVSAVKYFALVGGILLVNFFMLRILVESAGIEKHIGKLIVEITLFIISWLVQRLFVFKKTVRGDGR